MLAAAAAAAGLGNKNKHLLFLTDGAPTQGDTLLEEEQAWAKRLGVLIHTVFIGDGEFPPILDTLGECLSCVCVCVCLRERGPLDPTHLDAYGYSDGFTSYAALSTGGSRFQAIPEYESGVIRLHNREDGPLDLTGGLCTAASAMVASDDGGGGNVDPQQQQQQPSVTIPGDGGGGGEQDGRLHKGEPPPCTRSLCPSVFFLIPGLVCSCARSRSLTFVGFYGGHHKQAVTERARAVVRNTQLRRCNG
eukprot:COSAG05_NODE_795_length_7281_cov_33.551100_3_plen_248_part_00